VKNLKDKPEIVITEDIVNDLEDVGRVEMIHNDTLFVKDNKNVKRTKT